MRRPDRPTAETDWQAKAQEAWERSGVYQLLAALFAGEPSPALLATLGQGPLAEALESLGANLTHELVELGQEDAAAALASEYTRLFLGPGPHLAPYESLYRGDPGQRRLWGEPAVRIRRFVRFLGLEFERDYGGIPDHLSVELDLMCKLTEREARAWDDEDLEGAAECLGHERRVLVEHLARWVPSFCQQVQAQAQCEFYRQASNLLRQFVAVDTEVVERSLVMCEGLRPDVAGKGP